MLPVSAAIKCTMVAVSAVPIMYCGLQWACPSWTTLNRMRTAVRKALWGFKRQMRCPEIVIAVLFPPDRVDPASAMTHRVFCDARRYLSRSDDRLAHFYAAWRTLRGKAIKNRPDPV